MASIESIMEHLLRMEREQKVRDDGLRRAFHNYADAVDRLRQTIVDMEMTHRMPMEMGEFMTLMTTMLNRQKQLLESIGERARRRSGVERKADLDDSAERRSGQAYPVVVLTYRTGAAGAAAGAMAEYLQGSRDVPEMAAKLASYLGGSYALDVTAGTAALPMLDMHPLIADLLGIDTTRSLTQEEMTHLLAGSRADGQPVPGRDIQPSTKDNVRLGFCDFTFSAPKSLSIAISLAETEPERITLETCFMRANNKLMAVVAEEIGGARRGHAGRDGVVPGHVAVIQYHHHTARPTETAPKVLRPGDMQRHIHNVIPHVTITDDGEVKSPNLGASKGRIHEWGAIGHAFLAAELRAKGVRVEIDPRTGLSHLPDVPEAAVDLFSTRTRAAEAAARAAEDFDTLDQRDQARAVKGKVKAARKDKEDLSEAEFWKKTAAEAGYQHRSVIDPVNRRHLLPEAERTANCL